MNIEHRADDMWEAGRNRFMDTLSPGTNSLRIAAAEVIASWEGLSEFTMQEAINALSRALNDEKM